MLKKTRKDIHQNTCRRGKMNNKLYIKIAYWYYTLGLTQEEIGKKISLSRQKVNQIINSLVDLGVVTININGYERDNIEYECRLEEMFNLKEVIIASDYGETETAFFKVTNVAAQYLERQIQNGDIIGISWGRALAGTIRNMTFQKHSNCQVIQLMGAQNMAQPISRADEIVREMANKLECPSHMLYAPVVVEHEKTKEMLMQEKSIKLSYELMKKCDLAVFGIGELTEKSTMGSSGYLSKEEIRKLNREGFVADLTMNPIRLDGTWDNCFLEKRILSADMECINNIPNVILVACGAEKVRAILAALRTGCADTLITDETTAKLVIDLNDIV